MRSITFRLNAKLSTEQQDTALEKVCRVPGVSRAESLFPECNDASLRRLGYAYVNDDAPIERVLKDIESLREVEDASLPAERSLVGNMPAAKVSRSVDAPASRSKGRSKTR
jgi:hypothetical protein